MSGLDEDRSRSDAAIGEGVSVLIPAYNEVDLISQTVAAALEIPGVTEVIVVDDASTDGTAEAATSAGAHRVIRLHPNAGKGGALNRAWPEARGAILLLLDADLGGSASEGHVLLEPLLCGEADMSIAVFGRSREASDGSGVQGLAARSGGFGLVVKTARRGIRWLTGRDITAPLSGQRALRREIVERCGGFPERFGVEVGLTVDVLRMGYRIAEVPVHMVHRASGRDMRGFLHRGRQMQDVLSVLVRKALRR